MLDVAFPNGIVGGYLFLGNMVYTVSSYSDDIVANRSSHLQLCWMIWQTTLIWTDLQQRCVLTVTAVGTSKMYWTEGIGAAREITKREMSDAL